MISFVLGVVRQNLRNQEFVFVLGETAISKRRSTAKTRRGIPERKSSNGRRAATITFGT